MSEINFCSKCGAQVTDPEANFCMKCGNMFRRNEESAHVQNVAKEKEPAPEVMEPPKVAVPEPQQENRKKEEENPNIFSLRENEQIVLEMKGSHMRGIMSMDQGTFYLTNERIVFARPSKAVRFWAPMAEGFVKGVDISFAHYYTEIAAVTIKKHGFAKKIVVICKSGATYNILPMKWEKFMDTMRVLVAMVNNNQLTDDGTGGFTVA